MLEYVLYEKTDGVAYVTLNRPELLNALIPPMVEEICRCIQDASEDNAIRVVVITGSGRAFCAGGDANAGPAAGLRNPELSLAEDRNFLRRTMHRLPRLLRTVDKPLLAAVNGVAVGAGMDIASMCDIRMCSDSARFAMSYVRVGITPGEGGCYYLPRIIGVDRALDLIWTGRVVDAEEALDIRYVWKVVPGDSLMTEVSAYAAKLAQGPAIAVQESKRLVYRCLEVDGDAALDLAQYAMVICQATEDAQEGLQAFTEKRQPQFKGR